MENDKAGPLNGVKVLDLSNFLFAPYATQILGDLGADVIKVETPEGDVMRRSGPSPSGQGMGPMFMACNRNKRSVVLDLHKENARAALDRMIVWADVVIHNIRDEHLTKMRLTYQDVCGVKPDVIYVHCVGFGSAGPYAGRAAFDQLIQSATGTTDIISQLDGNPEPRFIPTLMADKTSSLYAAYGIMGGIIHKLRTGEGQHIEVPMFEALASFTAIDQLFGHTFDPPIGPIGYGSLLSKHQKPIKAKDGYLCVMPYTTRQWHATLEAVGKGDLVSEPRFATIESRVENMDELAGYVADAIPTKTNAEWVEIFGEAGVPAMPVSHIEDLTEDEHLREVGAVTKVDHPTEGATWMFDQPVRFSSSVPETRHLPPGLGDHTREVLGEFGLTEQEIDALSD